MRSGELAAAGIHHQTLSRMVHAGKVAKMCRGIYQLPDEFVDDLAETALQVPHGVVCLVSALQFHDLTLQMPRWTWMAIGRSAHRPTVLFPPVKFVRFGEKAMSLGVEKHVVDGVEVRVSSPAKAVVDCFRYRRRGAGLDVALEGLRNVIERGKAKPAEVGEIACELSIWTVIRPYLEVVAVNV